MYIAKLMAQKPRAEMSKVMHVQIASRRNKKRDKALELIEGFGVGHC